MQPPGAVRGGALLVHGLTDSPYSMRAVADALSARGYYVLALRMPGHGTVPGGLTRATAEDWMAAVRMGARHVRTTVGDGRPLVLVGYSNGGALVVRYALAAAADVRLPAPASLVLISPMIGVSPLAAWPASSAMGRCRLRKGAGSRWSPNTTVQIQFVSATAAFELPGCRQSSRRATAVETHEVGFTDPGLQSLWTPTVTRQRSWDLFDSTAGKQPRAGMFAINRRAGLDRSSATRALVATLAAGERGASAPLITNVSADVAEVRARSISPGQTTAEDVALGMSWPEQVFSLSHVALPFAKDDPVYGSEPAQGEIRSLALGRLSPRGEKAVLTVPVDTLMRIGWNPFLPFSWSGCRVECRAGDGPPVGRADGPYLANPARHSLLLEHLTDALTNPDDCAKSSCPRLPTGPQQSLRARCRWSSRQRHGLLGSSPPVEAAPPYRIPHSVRIWGTQGRVLGLPPTPDLPQPAPRGRLFGHALADSGCCSPPSARCCSATPCIPRRSLARIDSSPRSSGSRLQR